MICATARAEQLPIKAYTPAEGLVHDRVRCIKRDSHGFLWFCTGDGLSRFDGYKFTNYNSAQGLQQPAINDLIERSDGSYWLATNGGAILFNPAGESAGASKFTLYAIGDRTNKPVVQTFYEDREKRLWAGTMQGLFYFEETDKTFRQVDTGFPEITVYGILEDDDGSLWIASNHGVIRHLRDGRNIRYQFTGNVEHTALDLVFDGNHHLWVGFIGGLLILAPEAISDIKSEQHLIAGIAQPILRSGERLALPDKPGTEIWLNTLARDAQIWGLLRLRDGSIWIANRGAGITSFRDGLLQEYTIEQGLTDNYINTLEEDPAGNIWAGTETGGALKITRHGFIAFRESDGLSRKYVRDLFETVDGKIVVILSAASMLYLDGNRFLPLKLPVPPAEVLSQTLGRGTPFQDHLGDWWIATTKGLYHYSKAKDPTGLGTARPDAIYTEKNGLPNLNIAAMNEDSRGDVWIGTTGNAVLTRWERSSGKFYVYGAEDGVPPVRTQLGFAEDKNGNIWFGFTEGDVLRFKDGKFHLFTQPDGIPPGTIPNLFTDSLGHLWIPSWRGGVTRVDNPNDDQLKVHTYTPSNGLSSINTRCVTEDKQGRIYIGTVRGIDRLNVETGEIKHYTVTDGLSYSETGKCLRDGGDVLWFSNYRGLSKFIPEKDENPPPSPTFISDLHIAGTQFAIRELGVDEIGEIELGPAQDQIQVDFFSISFATGETMRYQYKFEGANNDWSEASTQRTINFANLAPGDYHFSVRAIDSAGHFGKAATINFKILPPFWRRWWFLLLVFLILAGVFVAIERYRAARLRELKTAFGNLRVSEQRFRQMIEQSPLGTVIFDPNGVIISINRAYGEFWGVTLDQLRGWDFLADEQIVKNGVAERLSHVFKRGEAVTLPSTSYDPQKNSAGVKVDEKAEARWIDAFAYPVKADNGDLLEVIMVMEDVTDTKRADELLQNARKERLHELEQVRKRIAADLHDDIGSSLTQISIFSEVLQQRIDKTDTRVLEPLEFIAGSSRELVDAMSDIVWAINPSKDFFSELSGKMRRFAADIFTVRNIEFTFDAPDLEEFALGANIRREIYLIYKESINNIVKHSGCRNVNIVLNIDRSTENPALELSIGDDGAGFDIASRSYSGHGLTSMVERAKGLGGTLEIVADNGTTIKLVVPISGSNV